jgi:thioredoxin 1
MGKPITLTDADFDAAIAEGVTLVDFWAPWCGPCRMIAPVVEELAEEYEGKAKIAKVNTDDERHTAMKYGIRSIPTLIIFKDGKPVDHIIGAQSKAAFSSKLEAALSL